MNMTLNYGHSTAVISTLGAQLISLKGKNGREVMWQADPDVWPEHAPVLFPICGAPLDGRIIMKGKDYPMPKHGLTRVNPNFEIVSNGPDYVDLLFVDTPSTRKLYPYAFRFHVIYELYEQGIRTTFLVENPGPEELPFCAGGHPAFNCPMEEGAVFDDYDIIFEKEESGCIARTPGGGAIDGEEKLPFFHDGRILPLNHREIDLRDSWLFDGLNSRSVRLENRKTGRGLSVRFPKMEALAIWSMKDKAADYICIEPWHGIPARAGESGRMEDKPYVTLLRGGEISTLWYDIEWDL